MSSYQRHHPEQTLLYQLVEQHYPQLLATLAEQDQSLPRYVRQEFEDYLTCVEWREGSDSGIHYARFRMDESNPSSPTVIRSKFEPGVRVPAHTHDSHYFEYILEGEQAVGKQTFAKGDIRLVKGGAGYGPIVVGANGCTVLIVF